MSGCNNCSDTNSGSGVCPTLASKILWDGGALCNGISPNDVAEAVQAIATSLCNLGVQFNSFTGNTDDVELINLNDDCFTATDGDSLTDWINEAQTKLCGLITTVSAINSDSVLIYDDVNDSITDESTQTNIKTYSIPANTFTANGDYLHLELYAENTDDTSVTDLRFLILKINSTNAVAQILDQRPSTTKVKWNIYITRGKSDQLDFDGETMSILGNGGIGGYKTIPAVYGSMTGLTFTNAIPLLIEGIQKKGTLMVNRVRLTKYTMI